MTSDQVAHLEMCECGLHGRVVTSQGLPGPDFPSKEMGLKTIRHVTGTELISVEEAVFLEQQVRDSNLPETDSEASREAWIRSYVETGRSIRSFRRTIVSR